ncbi:MAG: RsmE family RNA methyltransferase [Chitinophagaceae bacterium]
MALPYFYIPGYTGEKQVALNEDTSRHVVQVLRMKPGERLNLTDGNGQVIHGEIAEANKKHCMVRVLETRREDPPACKTTIAISLLKNANRFEWFLEKATELGVTEIIPLICERTEKEKFRFDRMNAICISAMLQSQQCRLPLLHEPVKFENMVLWKSENGEHFIAHCLEGEKSSLKNFQFSASSHNLICIGPEGDFTPAEIELALRNGFQPVSLGNTRLRTETAGVVAAVLIQ